MLAICSPPAQAAIAAAITAMISLLFAAGAAATGAAAAGAACGLFSGADPENPISSPRYMCDCFQAIFYVCFLSSSL